MSEKDLKVRDLSAGISAMDDEIDTGGQGSLPVAEMGFTDNNGVFQKRGLAAADIVLADGMNVQQRLAAISSLQEEVNDHMSAIIGSAAGIHGGRFNMDSEEFEFFNPVYGDFQSVNTGTAPAPQQIRTYGVQINLSNSNPYTAVTYIDNAVGMVGGSSMWDSMPIFRDIRPCLFNGGAVVGYLNPNNYAQWAEGETQSGTPDITSGAQGDVMIEIPKIGWRFSRAGNVLTIQITNDPNGGAQGFRYFAHTRLSEGDRNHLYCGAYKGFILESVDIN